MPFRPINPRNAILEAVIAVHLNRPPLEFEVAAVRALHPKLARDLPRLDPVSVGPVFFGPGGPPPFHPGAPVVMGAFKRDGTLDTRLMLNGPFLTVNFLTYTRWHELWPKATAWIHEVLAAATTVHQPESAPPLAIAGLAHQIIDVFTWQGIPGEVSIVGLFNDKPTRLPEAAWAAVGTPWNVVHSTNEPFALSHLPPSALVDFLSVDLSDETGIGWRLRLDHLVEVRFGQLLHPRGIFAQVPSGEIPEAETVMNNLHLRNRTLIQALLRPDVLSRIGLESS